MFIRSCIAIALVITGLMWLASDADRAMKQCQQTHSYDTCFASLNR